MGPQIGKNGRQNVEAMKKGKIKVKKGKNVEKIDLYGVGRPKFWHFGAAPRPDFGPVSRYVTIEEFLLYDAFM